MEIFFTYVIFFCRRRRENRILYRLLEDAMKTLSPAVIDAFIAANRRASELGLILFSSGNLSLRVDAERMIIKTSGSHMGALSPKEVSICSIGDGKALDGKAASKELGFHSGVLRERKDANAVFHFQSTYATAVACMKETAFNFHIVPEIPHFIGTPAYVEYHTPGSRELAEAVVEAARAHDMVILRNHGLVTVGAGLEDVIMKARYFEMACEIIVHVKDPCTISKKDAALLRKR
jgi:ribulose-5-phosphate 4-epimerase/fuculose-1-phosphate aldolase